MAVEGRETVVSGVIKLTSPRLPAAELKIPIKHFPADNTKLAEMEFYLLEDLDFHLHVFHPYRSLTALCGREPMDTGWFPAPGEDELEEDVKLGRGTGKGAVRFDKEIFETAWYIDAARFAKRSSATPLTLLTARRFIINDTYRTDLSLMYPPYLIAIACLYLAIAHFQAAHPGRSLLSATVQKQLAAAQAAQGQAQAAAAAAAASTLPGAASLPPIPVTRPGVPKSLNHPLPMNPLLQKAQQARLATPPPVTAGLPLPPNPSAPPLAMNLPPLPPSDPLAYFAHLNVNFSLVTVIVQDILALWPLWDSMEGGSSTVPGPAQGPTSAALNASAAKGSKAASAATKDGLAMADARGEGFVDGSQMVALIETMRAERDRDRSFPDGAWPVQIGRAATAGAQQQSSSGVKRSRG